MLAKESIVLKEATRKRLFTLLGNYMCKRKPGNQSQYLLKVKILTSNSFEVVDGFFTNNYFTSTYDVSPSL